MELRPGTRIGSKFRFAHCNGIIINKDAIIGDNVAIYQGVTIGSSRGLDGKGGAPVIGNNVFLFSGSKVIGKVVIGNNVIVGAGGKHSIAF